MWMFVDPGNAQTALEHDPTPWPWHTEMAPALSMEILCFGYKARGSPKKSNLEPLEHPLNVVQKLLVNARSARSGTARVEACNIVQSLLTYACST